VFFLKHLMVKKMLGYDFHRQKPIDRFVVDYCCPRLKLVLEIDGVTHDQKEKEDRIRQKTLESFGLFVLRFRDEDIKKNPDGVLSALQEWIQKRIQISKSTHP